MPILREIIKEVQNELCRKRLHEFYGAELEKELDTRRPSEEIIQILKALANPIRLWIFCLLKQMKMPVCLLVQILGLDQTLISHHLRVLKDANLVDVEIHGKFRFYKAKCDTVKRALELLMD